jgi:hypothetical protein
VDQAIGFLVAALGKALAEKVPGGFERDQAAARLEEAVFWMTRAEQRGVVAPARFTPAVEAVPYGPPVAPAPAPAAHFRDPVSGALVPLPPGFYQDPSSGQFFEGSPPPAPPPAARPPARNQELSSEEFFAIRQRIESEKLAAVVNGAPRVAAKPPPPFRQDDPNRKCPVCNLRVGEHPVENEHVGPHGRPYLRRVCDRGHVFDGTLG